jgi:hypothetical protein
LVLANIVKNPYKYHIFTDISYTYNERREDETNPHIGAGVSNLYWSKGLGSLNVNVELRADHQGHEEIT